MSTPLTVSHANTPEERWLRWEQRGQQHDARLLRNAKGVLSAVILSILLVSAALFVL